MNAIVDLILIIGLTAIFLIILIANLLWLPIALILR